MRAVPSKTWRNDAVRPKNLPRPQHDSSHPALRRDMNGTPLALAAASAVEQRLPQPTSRPLNRTLLAAAAASAAVIIIVARVRSRRCLQSSSGRLAAAHRSRRPSAGATSLPARPPLATASSCLRPPTPTASGWWDPTGRCSFGCPSIASTISTDYKFIDRRGHRWQWRRRVCAG